MLARIFPKEKSFFPLFQQISECLTETLDTFVRILENPTTLENGANLIKELESKADGLTHKVLHQLHENFITPFDRMHIQQFVSQLDEIIDLVHAVTERILMYEVKTISPETLSLGKKCQESAHSLARLIPELEKIKTPKEALRLCVDIHRLENEADHILRESLKNLFRNESDWKTFIKHKEINEMLESITDRAEDVANLVEGIILEYA